jgi:cytochrome c peroxidase
MRLLLGALGAIALVLAAPHAGADPPAGLTAGQVERLVRHGPWPVPVPRDASNRVSGNPAAIELGCRLFFDRRLSRDSAMSCATCHVPDGSFADRQARARGRALLERNTPSLWNTGLGRWFGWDGAADSPWAFSLRPILRAEELGASPEHVRALVATDAELRDLYRRAFAAPPATGDSERALVDAGKSLAAYLETLTTGRTPFDDFRDALARGDREAAARYPQAALRGAKIFVGKGNCFVCHFGPGFTNGEFHDVGIPYALGPGKVDRGRHAGIERLRADPYNLLGKWNDDPARASAAKTRHVDQQHSTFGQFKTPSLRNVALTAPFMHNGRLATLRDVVRHYSEPDPERLHSHGEQLLVTPLRLSPGEIDDLVAFLETLTDPEAGRAGESARECAQSRQGQGEPMD